MTLSWIRHPQEMGADEVRPFLTHLAVHRRVRAAFLLSDSQWSLVARIFQSSLHDQEHEHDYEQHGVQNRSLRGSNPQPPP